MQKDDDVQSLVDGVLVAFSLVATVHQVHGIAVDGEFSIVQFGLALDADLVGLILAGIVEYKDFLDFLADGWGNALQNAAERILGVVGNDQYSDFLHGCLRMVASACRAEL
jgi:hypothetical protein